MGAKFSATTLKVKLNVAVKRMDGRTNKHNNEIKKQRKEIAGLLRDGKDETARIRVEAVFHLVDQVRLYELLTLMCNLTAGRIGMIAQAKACPDDLAEACASLIYAASRTDIAELEDVAKQLAARFGEDWAKAHANNASGKVNRRVVQRLAVQPPTFAQTVSYLEDCARAAGVKWRKGDASPDDDGDDENAQRIGSMGGAGAEADGMVEYGGERIPTGTLTVRIHEAQRLYVSQMFAKQDPYCHVKVLGLKKVSYRSRVDKNAGDTAFFHEEYFPFTVKQRGLKLEVDVYNHNTLLDDFLGRAWVDVDSLILDGRPRWHALRRGATGKKDAGEVKLSAKFHVLEDDDDEAARSLQQRQAEARAGGVAGGVPLLQEQQQQQYVPPQYVAAPPQQPHYAPSAAPAAASAAAPAPAPAPAPTYEPQHAPQSQQQERPPSYGEVMGPPAAEGADPLGLPDVPRGGKSADPGEGAAGNEAAEDYDDLEARFRALQQGGRR